VGGCHLLEGAGMISIITPALVKDKHTYQWLHECIASVDGQAGDWEHIIVNDHSPVNLDALKDAWPGVVWLDAEGKGVSDARNQAAEAARGDLLLPLDADDKLGPDALAKFLQAWENRGDAGIIYSDVVMFGEDYSQVYLAAEYSFRTLLHATFMTVGCLHKKADWERIGGWRLDMTGGLEDWEYWITMGERGVCGKRLAEPLYWYRRHPRGRLQWLKGNSELWDRAYATMRELHIDSYNGRYPMGCCGGKAPVGATRPLHGGVPRPALRAVVQPPTGEEMILVYKGARTGDFRVAGGVTRTLYRVPGRGGVVEFANTGRQGVNPADVPWFRTVEKPKAAAPAPAPAPKPKPQPVRVEVEPAAWEPAIMEAEPLPEPVPDIQDLTVSEIRELDIEPDMALALMGQEQAGKQRKTALEWLKEQADG
jgi:hypothetical protein